MDKTLRPLTERQATVIELVARGQTTKEIAATLRVSDRAVSAVLSRLFRRFQVPNRAGLIAAVLSRRDGVDERRFATYEHAPFMAAVTLGPEHRYVFVNEVAARVAGRHPSTIVGRAVLDVYPEMDAGFSAELDRVFRTGRPWAAANAPARFTHPDGTYRDTRLNLIFQPLRDESGTVAGILHIGTELPD